MVVPILIPDRDRSVDKVKGAVPLDLIAVLDEISILTCFEVSIGIGLEKSERHPDRIDVRTVRNEIPHAIARLVAKESIARCRRVLKPEFLIQKWQRRSGER